MADCGGAAPQAGLRRRLPGTPRLVGDGARLAVADVAAGEPERQAECPMAVWRAVACAAEAVCQSGGTMRNASFPEPYPFPDPALADEDGLVALGVPVTPANLRAAYGRGIFPWPFSPRHAVPWVSPGERAVLEFDRLHIPKTLRQARRRTPWTFTIDRDFESVMAACAAARRPGQRGTWITLAMRAGYAALHREGGAHSVEAWDGERLVGGLYGVDAGGLFTGESMFHLEPNASKLALLHLVDHLAARGATWIDIQQLTPHFEVLGARVVPRDEFLGRLARARAQGLRLF